MWKVKNSKYPFKYQFTLYQRKTEQFRVSECMKLEVLENKLQSSGIKIPVISIFNVIQNNVVEGTSAKNL